MLDNLTVRTKFLLAGIAPTLCLFVLAVLGFTMVGSITVGVIAAIAAPGTLAIALHLGDRTSRRVSDLKDRLDELDLDAAATAEDGDGEHDDDGAPGEALGLASLTGGDLAALNQAVHDLIARVGASQRSHHRATEARTQALLTTTMTASLELVDQQLDDIDRLEYDEEDDERLGRLFQLDQVTARLHRGIARVLIAAGMDSFDNRSTPAPVADVVRVAIGQNADYHRIELLTLDEVNIAQTAARELTQLLAELLDNSSRNAVEAIPTEVHGTHLDDGSYRVTIIDRGARLDPSELARMQASVATPCDLGDLPDQRIGLNVVGRLARYLGATVDFSASADSGLTVDVRMPAELVAGEDRTPAPAPSPPVEPASETDADGASLVAPAVEPAETGEWTPPTPPPRVNDQEPAEQHEGIAGQTDEGVDELPGDRSPSEAPGSLEQSDTWTPPTTPQRSESWTPPTMPARLADGPYDGPERRTPVPDAGSAAEPAARLTDQQPAVLTRRTRSKSPAATQPTGPSTKPSNRSPREARSFITSYRKALRDGRRTASTDDA